MQRVTDGRPVIDKGCSCRMDGYGSMSSIEMEYMYIFPFEFCIILYGLGPSVQLGLDGPRQAVLLFTKAEYEWYIAGRDWLNNVFFDQQTRTLPVRHMYTFVQYMGTEWAIRDMYRQNVGLQPGLDEQNVCLARPRQA